MQHTLNFLLAVLLCAASAVAHAQTLETAPQNNGSGGIFVNLAPVGPTLIFTGFDLPLGPAAGTIVSVEVWTRPGTYVGGTDSNVGWTLTQTLTGTALGTGTPAAFVLTTPITLPTGAITAIYLHAVVPAASGSGIRYTGPQDAQTTWSNSDLVLFSDTSRNGVVPFQGILFMPRVFSGVIRYTRPDNMFKDGFEVPN